MGRKTTIILEDVHYFYLLETILKMRKQNRKATLGSLIRALIDRDRKETKGRKGN